MVTIGGFDSALSSSELAVFLPSFCFRNGLPFHSGRGLRWFTGESYRFLSQRVPPTLWHLLCSFAVESTFFSPTRGIVVRPSDLLGGPFALFPFFLHERRSSSLFAPCPFPSPLAKGPSLFCLSFFPYTSRSGRPLRRIFAFPAKGSFLFCANFPPQ